MNRASLGLLALLLSALSVGCTTTRREVFDLEVRNDTPVPLTITLTKSGPPFEPEWASPEDLAIETPRLREKREQWSGSATGMATVPPGKTAFVNKAQGSFDPGSFAYLRVYAGDLTLSQMLARSPGSPSRIDVKLAPGMNKIVVVDRPGGIKAEWEQ